MQTAVDSPPDGHKSHANKLHISPEHWRRLETMHPMTNAMDKNLSTWIDNHVASLPLASGDYQEGLTIPYNSKACLPFRPLKQRPSLITHIVPWIKDLPLQTAQSAFHLLFPETADYRFTLLEEDESENLDAEIFRYFTWCKSTRPSSDTAYTTRRLTVAFQPPWILSDKDIQMFSRCKTFPSVRKAGNAFPTEILDSQHRLWGKVWDVCVRNHTRWFVLTSYQSWVFGVFTQGWTAAFVSDVYAYDSLSPTIAECLVFWIASAMQVLGAASVPKVLESTAYRLCPASATLSKTRINFRGVPNSESHWDGKSDDAPSSAGAYISDTGSCTSGLTGFGPLIDNASYNTSLRRPLVTCWLDDTLTREVLQPYDPSIIPKGVRGVLRQVPGTRQGDFFV